MGFRGLGFRIFFLKGIGVSGLRFIAFEGLGYFRVMKASIMENHMEQDMKDKRTQVLSTLNPNS